MTTVEIVAVGNELLIGNVLDTNTNWLCKEVTSLGGQVRRTVMVEDELEAIADELRAALGRGTGVVFTTGGLGPTADDMTLAAVAQAIHAPLKENAEALAFVRGKYEELAEKGYVHYAELTEERRKMAILPRGALPLPNPVGSAPGVVLRVGKTTIICLPGVPADLKGIFTTSLQPVLQELFGERVFIERMALVDCGDESVLAPIIKSVAEGHPSIYVKSRAEGFGPEVKLKITLSLIGGDKDEVDRSLKQALHDLERVLTTAGISTTWVE
jgi:molybdenum cofactor synthesis domain-containing protein